MSIPTTRAKEKAQIKIYEERCTGCGLCASVCKDFSLIVEHGKVQINPSPIFGCIGCGHCMAICQTYMVENYLLMISSGCLQKKKQVIISNYWHCFNEEEA